EASRGGVSMVEAWHKKVSLNVQNLSPMNGARQIYQLAKIDLSTNRCRLRRASELYAPPKCLASVQVRTKLLRERQPGPLVNTGGAKKSVSRKSSTDGSRGKRDCWRLFQTKRQSLQFSRRGRQSKMRPEYNPSDKSWRQIVHCGSNSK